MLMEYIDEAVIKLTNGKGQMQERLFLRTGDTNNVVS